MAIGLLGWLAAWAGVPVSLPSGERAADWRSVLALGGLEWAEGPATVRIDRGGAGWVVLVGETRAQVPAPASVEAREDLVWLVVSLLTPVTAPDPVAVDGVAPPVPVPVQSPPLIRPLVPASQQTMPLPVPVPVPVPSPRVPSPSPVPVALQPAPERTTFPRLPPPPPKPVPVLPRPEPQPPAREAKPPRPPRPVPTPHPTGPWARLGPGLALSQNRLPVPSATLALGWAPSQQVEVGVMGHWSPSQELAQALGPVSRTLQSTDLGIEGWWAGPGVRLGGGGGAAIRRFAENGKSVLVSPIPFARVDGVLSLPIRGLWFLEPGMGYRLDLARTELRIDGVSVGNLPLGAVTGSFGLRFRP